MKHAATCLWTLHVAKASMGVMKDAIKRKEENKMNYKTIKKGNGAIKISGILLAILLLASSASAAVGSVFNVGDSVKTTVDLNVRTGAGIGYPVIKTESPGATGSVIAAPIANNGYYWVKISYSDGTIGWSAESGNPYGAGFYLQPSRCWEDQKQLTYDDAATKALYANFRVGDSSAATIVAIAMAESSLKPRNCNRNPGSTPSWDRGILQINSYWHPEVTDTSAFSGQQSFNEGYRISSNGLYFNQWSKYNNGAYLNYLGAARDAVKRVCGSLGKCNT